MTIAFLYTTPIGVLTLQQEGQAITGIHFGRDESIHYEEQPSPLLSQAIQQLEEYFKGKRKRFSLPVAPGGTPFQRRVWDALCQVPYGKTCTYGQIARIIGQPKACRAVGMANHRNPIAIVIPCHRIIGANGSLTGYAGGLEIKEKLLELERRQSND